MGLYDHEALSVNVGDRLRGLRAERGISMRTLAKMSGLSANALSMIERSMTSPSVSTLNKLANALEVPICAFFREEPERQKVVFCKAGERTRVPFMRGVWEGLGGEKFVGRMDAFMLTLESGSGSGPHGMLHAGHEFVFCLRGSIEYEVEGERYVLEAGDSLLFAARMTHRWRNNSNKVANAIVLISGFDDGDRPGNYHIASIQAAEQLQSLQSEGDEEQGPSPEERGGEV